jgi:hypothetical protein
MYLQNSYNFFKKKEKSIFWSQNSWSNIKSHVMCTIMEFQDSARRTISLGFSKLFDWSFPDVLMAKKQINGLGCSMYLLIDNIQWPFTNVDWKHSLELSNSSNSLNILIVERSYTHHTCVWHKTHWISWLIVQAKLYHNVHNGQIC